MRRVWIWCLGPRLRQFGVLFAGYLALFFVLTYPSGAACFSMFLGDGGDGQQTHWNIWWVKYAAFHLHVNPLDTKYIFFPGGASLLGHTLSLTNTVPAAVLALVTGPAVAYNLWLILGFVLGVVFTAGGGGRSSRASFSHFRNTTSRTEWGIFN
jgi:hypothetical protein